MHMRRHDTKNISKWLFLQICNALLALAIQLYGHLEIRSFKLRHVEFTLNFSWKKKKKKKLEMSYSTIAYYEYVRARV